MQFDIMCYFIQSFTLCTDHFANSCNLKIWPGRNYSLRHSYHLLEYILPVEVETVRQAKRVFIWLWKAASASISLYRYDSFTSDKITNFWLNSNQFFMFTHKVTSVTFRWKSTILTFCRNNWSHWTVLNSYIHFFSPNSYSFDRLYRIFNFAGVISRCWARILCLFLRTSFNCNDLI